MTPIPVQVPADTFPNGAAALRARQRRWRPRQRAIVDCRGTTLGRVVLLVVFRNHDFPSFLSRHCLPGKSRKQLRNLLNCKDMIYFNPLYGAGWDTRVHRLLGVLDDGGATMLLDGHHPHCAVVKGPRKEYAHYARTE